MDLVYSLVFHLSLAIYLLSHLRLGGSIWATITSIRRTVALNVIGCLVTYHFGDYLKDSEIPWIAMCLMIFGLLTYLYVILCCVRDICRSNVVRPSQLIREFRVIYNIVIQLIRNLSAASQPCQLTTQAKIARLTLNDQGVQRAVYLPYDTTRLLKWSQAKVQAHKCGVESIDITQHPLIPYCISAKDLDMDYISVEYYDLDNDEMVIKTFTGSEIPTIE